MVKIIVWKRYSDFKKLHKELWQIHKNLFRHSELFPPFAKGKVFGRFDDGVIEERRQCAEDLLQFSANIPALYSSRQLEAFFKGGVVQDGSELIGPAQARSGPLPDSLAERGTEGFSSDSDLLSLTLDADSLAEADDGMASAQSSPARARGLHLPPDASAPGPAARAGDRSGSEEGLESRSRFRGSLKARLGKRDYLEKAGEWIKLALQKEEAEDYGAASAFYRRGVDLLLEGVQVPGVRSPLRTPGPPPRARACRSAGDAGLLGLTVQAELASRKLGLAFGGAFRLDKQSDAAARAARHCDPRPVGLAQLLPSRKTSAAVARGLGASVPVGSARSGHPHPMVWRVEVTAAERGRVAANWAPWGGDLRPQGHPPGFGEKAEPRERGGGLCPARSRPSLSVLAGSHHALVAASGVSGGTAGQCVPGPLPGIAFAPGLPGGDRSRRKLLPWLQVIDSSVQAPFDFAIWLRFYDFGRRRGGKREHAARPPAAADFDASFAACKVKVPWWLPEVFGPWEKMQQSGVKRPLRSGRSVSARVLSVLACLCPLRRAQGCGHEPVYWACRRPETAVLPVSPGPAPLRGEVVVQLEVQIPPGPLSSRPPGSLRSPAEELKAFRVLGVIDKVLLVMDTRTEQTFILKGLRKRSEYSGNRKTIIPRCVPNMVCLHKYIISEESVFLVLQHAEGWIMLEIICGHSPVLALLRASRPPRSPDPTRFPVGRRRSPPPSTLLLTFQLAFLCYQGKPEQSASQPDAWFAGFPQLRAPPQLLTGAAVAREFVLGYLTGAADVRRVFEDLDRKLALSSRLSVPEDCVQRWAAELVVALDALHREGIVCRDLNPDNILLNDRGHIQLTYFSRWSEVEDSCDSAAVERMYCAPGQPAPGPGGHCPPGGGRGGVQGTLVECHPAGINTHTTLNMPESVSEEARSLIQQLLQFNPMERLGAGVAGVEDIKSHPFFTPVDWAELTR
ncbi:PREDICTED: ribosomal protein S6 kinase delta-1 [Condylura cristata]|uniref:ribosomal protein S6 kinase delta-1 n=1 Tax=Condylura cristata TaxID=143302 RepID=UPI000643CA37|nr:PREDICTED: ribosomal protein S6 kinase delta-1 [Condylura cristata]